MAVDLSLLEKLESGQSDKSAKLRQSLYKAVRREPDKEAEVQSLSAKHRLPAGTVDRNIDEVRRRDKTQGVDIDELLSKYPGTSQYLEDETNAAISVDDISILKQLEANSQPWYAMDWGKAMSDIGGTISEGVKQSMRGAVLAGLEADQGDSLTARAIRGTQRLMTGLSSEELEQVKEQARQQLLGQLKAGEEKVEELTPEKLSLLEQGVRSGVESLAVNAPGLMASLITRSPAPALATMGGYTGGRAYGESRAQGLEPDEASRFAQIDAAIEVGTELLPTGKLIDMVEAAGGKQLMRELTGFVASEIGGEQLATLGQTANAYLHDLDEQLNNAKTLGEMAAIQGERQLVTLFASIVGSGPQAGVATGYSAIVNRQQRKVQREINETLKSHDEADRLDNYVSLSQSSKTRERDAKRFDAFLESAAADEMVYLDTDSLAQLSEQGVQVPANVLQQSDSTGTDIAIPLREFLADPEFANAAREFARLRPEGQSRQQLNTDALERVRDVIQRANASAETMAESDQIYEQVSEQLIATGRLRPDEAARSAQLIPAYLAAKSEQTGVPVRDLYAQMGLRIEGPEGEADAAATDQETAEQRTEQGEEPTTLEQGISREEAERLIERQRAAEGMRAAVRDPETNEVYTGPTHQAAIDKVPPTDDTGAWGRLQAEWDRETDNVGFVDRDGEFMSRTEAEDLLGVSTMEDLQDLRSGRLRQAGDTETPARGSLALLEDERILRLNEASDLSTFIHESAHLFLEMEKIFSARYGLTEDQKTILDWLGAESFDEVTANTPEGREMHEKFAETFEVYAREGKAPSLRLRDAFAAFARWLSRIYTQMVGDGRLRRADLTEDMRGVFDRMLATQAEIDQAAAAAAYDPLFKTPEEAGMSEPEFSKYQSRKTRTRNRAEGDLYEQVVSQIRARQTQAWKEERAPLIEEERARLSQMPVYEIIRDLKTNKLDYEAVQEILGVDKMPGRLIGNARKGGVDPQEVAEIYGYPSARSMLEDVIAAPNLNDAATAAAEQRMIAQYGDLLNDGSIEEAAREALQNTAYAQRLVDELKALNRGQPAIDREALKIEARSMIGQLTYRQIRPSKYYQAEIKAAQKAATAETDADRIEAKTQQLANHYLYREAVEVKDRMVKNRRHVRRVQQRSQSQGYSASEVEPSYAQNMFALANLYEMRQDAERRRGVASLLEWYQAQVDDPNQFVNLELFDLQLIEALAAREEGQQAEYTPPHFDELTADQLQSVVDMLKHLRYVGGRMADADKARRESDIRRFADWIRERGGKDVSRRMGEERRHEKLLRSLEHAYHRMSSARNLARTLDGHTEDDTGLARDLIYTALERGVDRKLELNEQLRERFAEEMEGHYRLSISKAGRTDATITLEDGREWTLSSQARFMLAMYWGTESSREAIRQGYNVTDNDVMNMLSTLTPEQLRLVNATWKVNESLWPDLSEAAVKTLGVAPPKLDPVPFEVNGVPMTGGHMRLFYDGVKQEMQAEDKENSNVTSVTPSRAGSTYARIGSGGKPVQLEISNLQRAWDEAVHTIAFAEPAREIAAMLNARDVQQAIVDKHGEAFYQALIETVQGVTRNQKHREIAPWLASVMNITRRALVAKYLMYSPRNVAQQITALPIISNDVGNARYVEAAMRIASDRSLIETVRQKSTFMRNRTQLVNREAAEELKKISVDSRFAHIYQQFSALGFTPQTVVDATLAYPGWLAKYEQGIDAHGDEQRAISDANTLVAESVGSGSDLHLGGWFQANNPEHIKWFTMMGSWMQMLYQRVLRSSRGFTEVNRRVVRDAAVLPLMIGVIEAAVVLDMPDDLFDDPRNLLAWLAKKYGGTAGGVLPVVRDLVGAIEGFTPSTPYESAISGLARIGTETEQLAEGKQGFGEFALDLGKHTATALVPIPGSGTVIRFVEYWESFAQGNEGRVFNPYQGLVEGKDRNE